MHLENLKYKEHINCEICKVLTKHIQHSNLMRSDYSNNRNTNEVNTLVFTADLHKILLLQILSSKEDFLKVI